MGRAFLPCCRWDTTSRFAPGFLLDIPWSITTHCEHFISLWLQKLLLIKCPILLKISEQIFHLGCNYDSHVGAVAPPQLLFLPVGPFAVPAVTWARCNLHGRVLSGRGADQHHILCLSAESLCKARPRGRSWVLLWSPRTRSPPAAATLCNDFVTHFSASFCSRFLPQLLRMPTLSCRLTMPGWQLMTSEPSKCKVLKGRKGQGSMLQAVPYAPGAAQQLLLAAGGHGEYVSS